MEDLAISLEQLFEISENAVNQFDYAEFERKRIQQLTETEGELQGLDCPKCRNKGVLYYLDENGYRVARDCDCLAQRKTLRKIERSGLASTLQQLTFESYQVRSDWQSFVKNSALEFVEHPSHCFYIGGNTGARKTHICTAICGELIRKGYEVRYYLWRELLHRLEANRFKEYEYSQIMGEIQSADVLYLDDFLKSKGEKKSKYLMRWNMRLRSSISDISPKR